MEYTPKGVCSQQIHFDIVDHKVRNVSFRGGCNGNLQGISRLIDGMDVDEAIKRLDGVQDAAVSFMTQRLTIEADDARFEEIMDQVEAVCKKVEPDCAIRR